MRIDILTLFPEMFGNVLGASILGRAQAGGILDVRTHNIRDYAVLGYIGDELGRSLLQNVVYGLDYPAGHLVEGLYHLGRAE